LPTVAAILAAAVIRAIVATLPVAITFAVTD
jgi:hypothetical protein